MCGVTTDVGSSAVDLTSVVESYKKLCYITDCNSVPRVKGETRILPTGGRCL